MLAFEGRIMAQFDVAVVASTANLQGKVDILQGEVDILLGEVDILQGEVNILRGEGKILKDKVNTLTIANKELKAELANVKEISSRLVKVSCCRDSGLTEDARADLGVIDDQDG